MWVSPQTHATTIKGLFAWQGCGYILHLTVQLTQGSLLVLLLFTIQPLFNSYTIAALGLGHLYQANPSWPWYK